MRKEKLGVEARVRGVVVLVGWSDCRCWWGWTGGRGFGQWFVVGGVDSRCLVLVAMVGLVVSDLVI